MIALPLAETAEIPEADAGVEDAASIEEIGRTVWDALPSGSATDSHAWLRLLEHYQRPPRRYHYLTHRERQGIEGGMVLFEAPAGSSDLLCPRHYLMGGRRMLLDLPGACPSSWLVCAPRYDCNPPFRTHDPAPLIGAAQALAERTGKALALRAVPTEAVHLRHALADAGFLETLDHPYTRLSIRWASFEEYRRAMRSRSRRIGRKMGSEMRRFRAAGMEIRRIGNAARWSSRLDVLADAHMRRLSHLPHGFAAGWFHALQENLGEDCILLGAFAGRRLLGFFLILRHRRTAHLALAGVAPEGREHFVYLNLFYRSIAWAIEEGIETLYGGRLLYEMKWRRGFDLIPTSLHAWAPGRAGRLRLKALLAIHRGWARKRKFAGLERFLAADVRGP